jgi:hypothetical protein
MNSRKQKVLMAGLILATAASSFARAADPSAYFEQQREMTDGYVAPLSTASSKVLLTSTDMVASTESPQFEAFEHQMGQGDWKDYTPSEHGTSAPSNTVTEANVLTSDSAGGTE